MNLVIAITVALLGASIAVGVISLRTAEDDAGRAVVGDLLFFSTVGVALVISLVLDSAVIVDAAMLASLLGIIATVSLARILTRGRR